MTLPIVSFVGAVVQHLDALTPPMGWMQTTAVAAICHFRDGTTDPYAPTPQHVALPPLTFEEGEWCEPAGYLPAEQVVRELGLQRFIG